LKKNEKKTFIYLIPKRKKKHYNDSSESIIIKKFIKLGHTIIPIYSFYFINIISKLLTNKIDGIIVNSIKILSKNRLLLIFNKLIPIYWWYFDNSLLKEKNYLKSIQIAKKVSIFFNKHYKQFNNYIKMGIKPIWLDQGTSSKKEFINSQKFDYDIIFFGSLNLVHTNRTNILKNIDENYNLTIFTPSTKQFKKLGFKNVLPAIPHNDINKIVSKTKITLVLNATTKEDYCWSNRIHIMLGSGAFCLTDYIVGIENSYTDGEDCVFIKDLNSINKTINHWLNDEKTNERNRIRLNGYNKAHEKHTYENRINIFLNKINANEYE
tara:strand:+ start:669 stop:1637 length:969 start_codon:yes stop_codon:yes gene_type:complete